MPRSFLQGLFQVFDLWPVAFAVLPIPGLVGGYGQALNSDGGQRNLVALLLIIYLFIVLLLIVIAVVVDLAASGGAPWWSM